MNTAETENLNLNFFQRCFLLTKWGVGVLEPFKANVKDVF